MITSFVVLVFEAGQVASSCLEDLETGSQSKQGSSSDLAALGSQAESGRIRQVRLELVRIATCCLPSNVGTCQIRVVLSQMGQHVGE